MLNRFQQILDSFMWGFGQVALETREISKELDRSMWMFEKMFIWRFRQVFVEVETGVCGGLDMCLWRFRQVFFEV